MQLVEFLIFQICLGRRCLHNLVSFLFYLFFFPLAPRIARIFWMTRSPMAKRPSLAERQSRKEHGEEGKEKEENKVIKSSYDAIRIGATAEDGVFSRESGQYIIA